LKQSRDFEDFYAANYGKIAALVTAVTGDRHEAHDIAQEAFARALARCGNARCSSCTTSPICPWNRSLTTGASRSAR
jgi:DNA-directed RNA polymerase specialized sigma24 family protein